MIRHCYLAKMEVAARRLNLKIKVSLQTAFDTFIETKKKAKRKNNIFQTYNSSSEGKEKD